MAQTGGMVNTVRKWSWTAPPSVKITDEGLVELGDKMSSRIEQLRESTVHKLRVKGRKSMLRAL
jgi:hypothetical protein